MKKQKQIGEYIVHFASVFPAQEACGFSASLFWVDSSSYFHIFLAYWGHQKQREGCCEDPFEVDEI